MKLLLLIFLSLIQNPQHATEAKLQRIIEIRDQIIDIHPLLHNLYPISIFDGNPLHILDVDSVQNKYDLVKNDLPLMPLVKGIRAAEI